MIFFDISKELCRLLDTHPEKYKILKTTLKDNNINITTDAYEINRKTLIGKKLK